MRRPFMFFLLLLATLPAALCQPAGSHGKVTQLDPRLADLIDTNAVIEKLAGGFGFLEGPVWSVEGNYLLFSDIPRNTIYKWQDEKASVYRQPSHQANGLTFDADGRLVICEHESRCVVRMEKDGTRTVLADTYKGKKLNSPNDVVIRTDGTLYFTDPPWGLAKTDDDPAKEIPFNGVYRLANGVLTAEEKGMFRPNGLVLSPDEQYLYVANVDSGREVWARYEVAKDGSLRRGFIFFDATNYSVKGNPDGLKTDVQGNLYATGPDGIWILSPDGEYLGGIRFPDLPANCAFGDADGKSLYVTAKGGLYRVRTKVEGVRPGMKAMPAAIGNK